MTEIALAFMLAIMASQFSYTGELHQVKLDYCDDLYPGKTIIVDSEVHSYYFTVVKVNEECKVQGYFQRISDNE